MRILIVKTSSMGDVVHALPLAADLAAARSDMTVDWLVEEAFAAIPAMSAHVSGVHHVALRRWRSSPLAKSTRAEIRHLKRELRAARYDLVIDAQGLVKSAWVARWARAPVAGFASGSAREPLAALLYGERHAVARNLHAVERCRRLGAAALNYSLSGPPRFDLRVESAADTAPYAVLFPNASRPTKLWPAERWRDVERWLASRGLISMLFWGSEAEGERTQSLSREMSNAVVAPRTSLQHIAATVAGAAIVVGLDTGLSHLAAAIGRPTIGIYSDYDPALAGLVGPACASLGGVNAAPAAADVIAVGKRLLEGE